MNGFTATILVGGCEVPVSEAGLRLAFHLTDGFKDLVKVPRPSIRQVQVVCGVPPNGLPGPQTQEAFRHLALAYDLMEREIKARENLRYKVLMSDDD